MHNVLRVGWVVYLHRLVDVVVRVFVSFSRSIFRSNCAQSPLRTHDVDSWIYWGVVDDRCGWWSLYHTYSWKCIELQITASISRCACKYLSSIDAYVTVLDLRSCLLGGWHRYLEEFRHRQLFLRTSMYRSHRARVCQRACWSQERLIFHDVIPNSSSSWFVGCCNKTWTYFLWACWSTYISQWLLRVSSNKLAVHAHRRRVHWMWHCDGWMG